MRPLATLTPRNIVSSKRMRVGATTAAPQIATVEIQTTKRRRRFWAWVRIMTREDTWFAHLEGVGARRGRASIALR